MVVTIHNAAGTIVEADGSVAGATAQVQSFTKGMGFPTTTAAGAQGLYIGTSLLLHNCAHATADGYNLFCGIGAGNLTLSPGGGASTLASANVGFGPNVLKALTTGWRNGAFGYGVLAKCTTGEVNNGFGYGALAENTTGGSNSAFGDASLNQNTTGGGNSAFGADALSYNTVGGNNTALGSTAMYTNVGGDYNVAVGQSALRLQTDADNNVAIGYKALEACTVGPYNTALGALALYKLTTGTENVGLGYGALSAVTTGYYNTAVGNLSGIACTTGTGNVFLGYSAGFYETGSSKLFIDNATRASEADARTKALVYGVFAAAVASQSLRFNAGSIGFFGVAPVVQPTGCAVPTDLNTAIAAITALRTALVNLGLTTVE